MNDRERLLDELARAHAGDPWHGPSRRAVLADVTVEEAARQPAGGAHGIWALVLHMRAWTNEVARRLGGGAPAEPEEGDYPPVPAAPTAEAWGAAVRGLDDAHSRVRSVLERFPTERLDDLVGDERVPALGSGVTYRAMLHGLAQHDAYHSGQVAILKKTYRR